ncbi:MAG TPA: hypothetical protein VN957_12585 [Chthoniobacterales bacterium]|nr:hypothetical protein [Chthoniobacterales bacterium]
MSVSLLSDCANVSEHRSLNPDPRRNGHHCLSPARLLLLCIGIQIAWEGFAELIHSLQPESNTERVIITGNGLATSNPEFRISHSAK